MVKTAVHAVAEPAAAQLSLSELAAAVRAADRAAILVPSRILRRVIKQHASIPGLGLRVPHRKSYVISRDALLGIVTLGELGMRQVSDVGDPAILIEQPAAEQLAGQPAVESLIDCWRLLFHCRVHSAFDRAIAAGQLSEALVARRIEEIGSAEFREVRQVLKQEDLLLPPRDDRSTYVEFAALLFELRYFADGLLSCYFPALERLGRVEDILRQDLDAEPIFHASRPAGAPETPHRSEPTDEGSFDDLPPQERPLPPRQRSATAANRLLSRADKARSLGNLVRAAIFSVRAARLMPGDAARKARARARDDLERLAVRLQAALEFAVSETDDWRQALWSLADHAARGVWSPEARILYDLQKVCVDHERGVFGLNLFRWILTRGREPLKKPLPGHRDVLVSKRLHSASARLTAARLSGRARLRIASLLDSAAQRAETALRARFRRPIEAAFDQVQLAPQNLPERVARKKLVDELLDLVVERGFFLMGDLRDALSRNNLKLPDVAGLEQFVAGDQLLRANDKLAETLGGIYRRGEVYLTFPQRLSSMAFGTRIGRFLTRHVAIPFGGAYLLLEFMQHVVHQIGARWLKLVYPASVLIVGAFFLGLLRSAGFRHALVRGARAVGRVLRVALLDWPRRIARLPLVQAVLGSDWFRLARRFVLKPLALSVAIVALLTAWAGHEAAWRAAPLVFLGVNVLINSRLGRDVDELITDWLVQSWHKLRIHVLAAVLRWIADAFHYVLESLERLLYTVDEWLRFRSGETRAATVLKTVLGSAWFFVTYAVRFCVTLLIEPQINPIKHFPVVTVSHKILLPTIPFVAAALTGPLDKVLANTVATAVVFSLPGVFGFLVWELKENWRLYAANRPQHLRPVHVGHHGETVLQLMRPGFRSGTLPKLFARLRRASRRAYRSGNWKSSSKQLRGLHRVEEHVRRFVDRDFLELLRLSQGWGSVPVTAGEILLGTNRILIELYSPELAEDGLWISLENCHGWLLATVHRRGWLDQLAPRPWRTLDNALAGCYQFSGVELVREQVEPHVGRSLSSYRMVDEGLEIESRQSPGARVTYRPHELAADASLHNGAAVEQLADLPAPAELIFARTPISWTNWVIAWQLDQLGTSGRQRIIDGLSVLPGNRSV